MVDRGARAAGPDCAPRAGNCEPVAGAGMGRFPQCGDCGRVVRIVGVGRRRVLCIDCLCGALPFIWIPREGDYRRALQEHRGADIGGCKPGGTQV